MKIKAALIVDNGKIAKWQKMALEEADNYLDIKFILNCRNTTTKKRIFTNFGYYILNILSMNNDLTASVAVDTSIANVIDFNSTYNGMWQSIPQDIAEFLKDNDINMVIKFGMSLLRIDKNISNLDILSFHHGDPEYYRGRPAGFYEIYNNSDRIGIIVQKLNNKLDAGEILIRAHSKIYHHSYKKTVRNFHQNSKHLLKKAIINYAKGNTTKIEKHGQNYKLPSNILVIKFASKLIYRNIHRIIYGAFFEKKWNIVKFNFCNINDISNISILKGSTPRIKPGYAFYADPFFSVDGKKVRVEALNGKNGLGEIIELDSDTLSSNATILKGSHFSYPYSFFEAGIEYVMPEVASHSSPYLLSLSSGQPTKKILSGLDDAKIIDGSLYKHGGIYYLFGGHPQSSADCLFLYCSQDISGPYVPHRQNPIVMNPQSARMGGRLLLSNGKIYRFGQNNCYGYGDKITVSEIEDLSEETYAERSVGVISFSDARGPHTLDVNGDSTVLDFYLDKFSFLAGYRRFSAKVLRLTQKMVTSWR